jgi:histidinol phosphatase-like enzyme (inositol monophosphatase family)
MPIMLQTLPSLMSFALDAAWQAGRITLGYFQTGLAVERKADSSPVTRADKEAEEKLRQLIQKYYPEHGIQGEEFGQQPGKTNLTWILDPIDGTKSFVSGVPIYATLVALVQDSTPIIGVAHFPALNETVYALRDGGAFWNGRRARVSGVSSLKDAVLLGSDVHMGEKKQPAWERLRQSTYFQRTWGDAYGYALVATGRAEIMCDSIMNVWDCAPFGVIMEEAGGTFTDWRGRPTIHGGESVATNGVLFEPTMRVVRGS